VQANYLQKRVRTQHDSGGPSCQSFSPVQEKRNVREQGVPTCWNRTGKKKEEEEGEEERKKERKKH